MKTRFYSTMRVSLGVLVLWGACSALGNPQQEKHREDHSGHDHDEIRSDEQGDHTDANHKAINHTEGADSAEKHNEHDDTHDRRDDDDHADDGQTADDEHGHDDEAEHDEEAGEGRDDALHLSPEVMREFGIEMRRADGGRVRQTVRLPGEVVYNSDRIADVMPSVGGVIQRVNVSVGDLVEAGQTLAVLRSRELASARSAYLAAQARLSLAKSNLESQERLYRSRLDLAKTDLERDRRLFEEKVGSERAFLTSKQRMEEVRVDGEMAEVKARKAIDEADISLQQAETALHALGLNHEQINRTESLGHGELSEYNLVAPLDGMVTERDLTVGEVIQPTGNGAPLVVADLSTVWVNLTVYQRDLARVAAGQAVTIKFGHGIPDTEGQLAFVSPSLDESTRTAFARIVLDNPEGHWRPGLFVEGVIETGHDTADVVVPRSAVIGMDGRQVVFVESGDGLKPRPVRFGRGTEGHVEIREGLRPGQRYAATGVLTLKSQYNSSALEHAGHAH